MWLSQLSAQLLILASGHDLTVHGFEPHARLHADSVEPIWDILSAPPAHAHTLSLSLKINKL